MNTYNFKNKYIKAKIYKVYLYQEVIHMSKGAIKINKKGEDGYKVISMRIKDGTLEKIDFLSKESNRSRNEIINILLESSVDDAEVEE